MAGRWGAGGKYDIPASPSSSSLEAKLSFLGIGTCILCTGKERSAAVLEAISSSSQFIYLFSFFSYLSLILSLARSLAPSLPRSNTITALVLSDVTFLARLAQLMRDMQVRLKKKLRKIPTRNQFVFPPRSPRSVLTYGSSALCWTYK